MYTVDFVGIIYFDLCRKSPEYALVPDGTTGSSEMPPHYPSLFIAAADYDLDNWWGESKTEHTIDMMTGNEELIRLNFFEFRIPHRVELTFDCAAGRVDADAVKDALPHLFKIDDQFVVDDSGSIVKIAIPGGRLTPYSLEPAVAVRWTIHDHFTPIVIRATDEKETRSVTLKAGQQVVEVVVANTPDLLRNLWRRVSHRDHVDSKHDPSHNHDCGHFELFGRINKGPNGATKFKCPNITPPKLEPLPFSSPFLTAIMFGKQIPNSNCSPTCC